MATTCWPWYGHLGSLHFKEPWRCSARMAIWHDARWRETICGIYPTNFDVWRMRLGRAHRNLAKGRSTPAAYRCRGWHRKAVVRQCAESGRLGIHGIEFCGTCEASGTSQGGRTRRTRPLSLPRLSWSLMTCVALVQDALMQHGHTPIALHTSLEKRAEVAWGEPTNTAWCFIS